LEGYPHRQKLEEKWEEEQIRRLHLKQGMEQMERCLVLGRLQEGVLVGPFLVWELIECFHPRHLAHSSSRHIPHPNMKC
jgi:hypothetical protein